MANEDAKKKALADVTHHLAEGASKNEDEGDEASKQGRAKAEQDMMKARDEENKKP